MFVENISYFFVVAFLFVFAATLSSVFFLFMWETRKLEHNKADGCDLEKDILTVTHGSVPPRNDKKTASVGASGQVIISNTEA